MILKMGGYVCDSCRKLICYPGELPKHARQGKKRELHFCSDRCLARDLSGGNVGGKLPEGGAGEG